MGDFLTQTLKISAEHGEENEVLWWLCVEGERVAKIRKKKGRNVAAGSEKERERIKSEIKGNKIKDKGKCSVGEENKINCILRIFMKYSWAFNCHKYNMTISLMGIYIYNPKSIICQIQYY